MKKSLKILVLCLIYVFFIFVENCLAVNIDMNLSSNLVNSGNITDSESYNSTGYSNDDNFNIDDLDDNALANYTSNEVSNNDSASSNSTSTTPSSNRGSSIADALQSLPESELGLTNILNILLIAVGVVLILLAIAIFIRLKH